MTLPLAEQMLDAMNSHDADRFSALFTEDYDSNQPAHPDRAFRGREQVRRNWTAIFTGVPDFRAEILAATEVGDRVWIEWSWHGTQTGGDRLEMVGVTVLGLRDGLIAWARLYMEDVAEGAGIDRAVEDMGGRRAAPP